MADWFRERADGIELFVRLTPRAARDAVDGIVEASDGSRRLAARVRAVPEKGAANVALVALLASTFSVPKKAVVISAGASARLKTVHVTGDAAALVSALRALEAGH